MTKSTVGARIRAARDARGWTQQRLADELGRFVRTVQRYEAEGVTDLGTLQAVSKALDVPLAEFVTSNGDASLTRQLIARVEDVERRVARIEKFLP